MQLPSDSLVDTYRIPLGQETLANREESSSDTSCQDPRDRVLINTTHQLIGVNGLVTAYESTFNLPVGEYFVHSKIDNPCLEHDGHFYFPGPQNPLGQFLIRLKGINANDAVRVCICRQPQFKTPAEALVPNEALAANLKVIPQEMVVLFSALARNSIVKVV